VIEAADYSQPSVHFSPDSTVFAARTYFCPFTMTLAQFVINRPIELLLGFRVAPRGTIQQCGNGGGGGHSFLNTRTRFRDSSLTLCIRASKSRALHDNFGLKRGSAVHPNALAACCSGRVQPTNPVAIPKPCFRLCGERRLCPREKQAHPASGHVTDPTGVRYNFGTIEREKRRWR